MAEIPNLEQAGVQEQAQTISTPQETQAPAAATPIQEVQQSKPQAPEAEANQSAMTTMQSVQEQATETINKPPAQPVAQEPVAQEAKAVETTTTQSASANDTSNPQGSGAGANSTPASASVSEGSGVQVEGNTVPSFTQNMSPEELESFRVTQQMISKGEGNIVEFMAGNSPLDAMIMDKAVQQMRAGNNAQLTSMKQSLVENGLGGKGEGNALLSMMARDQNVAMGDMMATLTIDARNRLEQWNKFGLDYGNQKFNKMKSDDLAMLDYIIAKGGSPEEMNEQAAVLSEKYGVVMPDFTDPNNMTNYNQSKERYNDFQVMQSDRLANGDFEGFKAAHEKMAASGEFSNMAFWSDDVPKLDDFVRDYDIERQQIEMQSLNYNTQFLVENGQSDIAATQFADAFQAGGVFNTTGEVLSTTALESIRRDFVNTTPEEQAWQSNMTSIMNTLKQNGSKEDVMLMAQEIYDENPNSSLGRQMKLYIDNPNLIDMPKGYLDDLNTSRRTMASNFVMNEIEPDAEDIRKYTANLVDAYGEKGLADKGREIANTLSPEKMAEYGMSPDSLIDDEDFQELYSKYDLEREMKLNSANPQFTQLKSQIKAMFNTDEYFDSPSEIKQFDDFLAQMVGSGYKVKDGEIVGADGQSGDMGIFPWDNPEYTHIYEDLEGNAYSGDYTKEMSDNDIVMGAANSLFNEYKTQMSYQDFQKIFQDTTQEYPFSSSNTGSYVIYNATLKEKLTEAANTHVNKSEAPQIEGIPNSTMSALVTKSPSGNTSGLVGGGNYNSDKWKLTNSLDSNDMLNIVNSEANTSGDVVDKMVDAGGLWDLSTAVTVDPESVSVRGYTTMDLSNVKYVYADGTVYQVVESDGSGNWGIRNIDPNVDATIYRPKGYKGY